MTCPSELIVGRLPEVPAGATLIGTGRLGRDVPGVGSMVMYQWRGYRAVGGLTVIEFRGWSQSFVLGTNCLFPETKEEFTPVLQAVTRHFLERFATANAHLN